ncbi:hypothetical protein GOZ97_14160 [Agrobacterium vitis]|nr:MULTISPECIES: hypothetical protein [Rhizobium/Agrobacterium group]MUO90922.1 hypothetical protein [Agrobacterium vitis]MUZ51280.1 hypothetical protein [Agrobacterium vitis]MUZ92570.1 hypothetical protein [Agrobacterium vitis]MVA38339.1 hypothetical protein [Agrobacterium vitis]NSX98415.1 hypothetical protein [Agrobacterium vitis]
MFNNKKTACDKHLPDGWLPPFIRMGNRARQHKDSAAKKNNHQSGEQRQ